MDQASLVFVLSVIIVIIVIIVAIVKKQNSNIHNLMQFSVLYQWN